jgi:8-oxo-dGTP diphosphatase
MIEKVKDYIKILEKDSIPQLSVNCVIFGFHQKKLHVVVNRFAWGNSAITVLPGGYVGQQEAVADAMVRVVRESTGLEKILLKQFAVFGSPERSFQDEFKDNIFLKDEADQSLMQWMSKRFVSICYLALVDYTKISLQPTQFLEAAQWLPVEQRKTLSMDHGDMVKSAQESLLKEFPYTPIASNLLPARFTLPELQALVESILGREVDRPNFRRKILNTGMIKKVGQDNSNKRRPADLYAFKHGKKTSLIDEYKFGF